MSSFGTTLGLGGAVEAKVGVGGNGIAVGWGLSFGVTADVGAITVVMSATVVAAGGNGAGVLGTRLHAVQPIIMALRQI
jgi:hypothetical protein